MGSKFDRILGINVNEWLAYLCKFSLDFHRLKELRKERLGLMMQDWQIYSQLIQQGKKDIDRETRRAKTNALNKRIDELEYFDLTLTGVVDSLADCHVADVREYGIFRQMINVTCKTLKSDFLSKSDKILPYKIRANIELEKVGEKLINDSDLWLSLDAPLPLLKNDTLNPYGLHFSIADVLYCHYLNKVAKGKSPQTSTLQSEPHKATSDETAPVSIEDIEKVKTELGLMDLDFVKEHYASKSDRLNELVIELLQSYDKTKPKTGAIYKGAILYHLKYFEGFDTSIHGKPKEIADNLNKILNVSLREMSDLIRSYSKEKIYDRKEKNYDKYRAFRVYLRRLDNQFRQKCEPQTSA